MSSFEVFHISSLMYAGKVWKIGGNDIQKIELQNGDIYGEKSVAQTRNSFFFTFTWVFGLY